MQILIDADAAPVVIKDILFRAAIRNEIPLILVANQPMRFPQSPYISSIVVSAGPDEADNRIAEIICPGDLVITADIPLADRVVTRGGFALNPRGEFYTEANIKERLAMRDLMDDLRNSGIQTGAQAVFSSRDRQAFANQLDRFLTKYHRNRKEEI
ncbi:MAG TPA: YaiI/YqxD family protein [Spirochaetota bacterium]|nr:YaiI/YqxD family protein [Spirochaetota bacterium]HPJ39145.1 YaiI/YqxD family protein [Spirochaetota bacterium]HPQ55212.1 YaiI/YqxD family protein [Spirochaetota bacterium]